MTTPVMIVERPSSKRTISAAARAASVQPRTATPTSALFKAGASFTPSPCLSFYVVYYLFIILCYASF